MDELSRYNVNNKDSGVENGILKNKLNIIDQTQLDNAESILLEETHDYFLEEFEKQNIKFNLELLFEIHNHFLGTLYSWAGKIRRVDMSKGGTFFIPAQYINNALTEFEKVLKNNIPTPQDTKKIVAHKIALIHCEFNAIHPFREGNGRTIRIFLDLLARNAKYDIIEYTKSSLKTYIQACKDGMKMEYKKMETVIYRGLKKKK